MSSLLEAIRRVRGEFPELWQLCQGITMRCEGTVVIQPDDAVIVASGSIVLRGERLVQLAPRDEDRPRLVSNVSLQLLQRRSRDTHEGDHEIRATHNGEVDVRIPTSHLVLWVKEGCVREYADRDSRAWREGARIQIARADRIEPNYLETLKLETGRGRGSVDLAYSAGDRVGMRADGEAISFSQSGKLQLCENPGQITFRWWMPDGSVLESAQLAGQPPDIQMRILGILASSGPHSMRAALNAFFNGLFFLSDPQTLIVLPQALHGSDALMNLLKIPANTGSPFFKPGQLNEYPRARAFFDDLAKNAWDKENTDQCATAKIASLPESEQRELLTVLAVPSLRGTCEVALRVLMSYQQPDLVAVHRVTNLSGHRAFVSPAA